MYVSNFGSGSGGGTTISQFSRAPAGALTQLLPAAVTSPTGPLWMAITPDRAPVATWAVRSKGPGTPTRFDGSLSTDPDGTIARYDWDFGDGHTATTTTPTVAHTYARRGSFAGSLTVTDDLGCSTTVVFTGQNALCNGWVRAQAPKNITVPRARFDGVAFTTRTAIVRNGRAGVRLRCRANTVGRCFGKLILRDRGRTIGHVGFRIRAGHATTLHVPLTAFGRFQSLRANATAKAHDRFGTKKTTKRTLTLRR